MSKIKIVMTDHCRGKVYLDDVEVRRVKSVRFSSGLDEVNRAYLEILPDQVEIEGDADVLTVVLEPQKSEVPA